MLRDCSLAPENGKKPEYLVIFFHGYGSSGEALMKHHAGTIQEAMPAVKFRFPDAPIDLGNGRGCSWFDVEDFVNDNDKPVDNDIIHDRAMAALPEIVEYINAVIGEEGIDRSKVILAAFSQGSTMAYYAGMTAEDPVGGIYSQSGGALDRLEASATTTSVMLVAGEYETGNFSGIPTAKRAADMLQEKGVDVEVAVLDRHAHVLTEDSFAMLAKLVRKMKKNSLQKQRKSVPQMGHTRRNTPKL
jgi:predicted esterase